MSLPAALRLSEMDQEWWGLEPWHREKVELGQGAGLSDRKARGQLRAGWLAGKMSEENANREAQTCCQTAPAHSGGAAPWGPLRTDAAACDAGQVPREARRRCPLLTGPWAELQGDKVGLPRESLQCPLPPHFP